MSRTIRCILELIVCITPALCQYHQNLDKLKETTILPVKNVSTTNSPITTVWTSEQHEESRLADFMATTTLQNESTSISPKEKVRQELMKAKKQDNFKGDMGTTSKRRNENLKGDISVILNDSKSFSNIIKLINLTNQQYWPKRHRAYNSTSSQLVDKRNKTKIKKDSEPKTDPETESKTEPRVESSSKSTTEAKTETTTEVKFETKMKPKHESIETQIDPKTVSNIKQKSEPEIKPTPESTIQLKSESKTNLNSESKTEYITESLKTYIRQVCPKFQYGKSIFYVNSLADIWQTVYYELPEKLQCFKIHIKKVSFEEKMQNELKYGNYSGKVNWMECNLEIRSSTVLNRKHFLQGVDRDYGVLHNVIIEKRYATGKLAEFKSEEPTYHLVEETPDQWLVIRNLLLMRDCLNGGVVVFSRVPLQPGQGDIRQALKEFGEEKMNGKMACYDEEIVNKSFDEPDHQFF